MADGPAGFTQDFSCPALLRIPLCFNSVSAKGLSPAMALFSSSFAYRIFLQPRGPTTPSRPEPWRFGLFPVRSPLLGESFLFSLPPGTKMFQFPGLAHAYACVWSSTIPVSRFRYLRITSCLQIPGAFRSLPRLSSPLEAKASSVRSSLLSLS